MSVEKPGWRALPIAATIPTPSTSRSYRTGEWRTSKPILDTAKCTNCLICWIYCPEPTIKQGEKHVEIDYTYCKGCGICASECPVKAITMVAEE